MIRDQVVELATTTYAGVNHTHLTELLAEREGLDIAERTLRRILAEASVRPVRTRRSPRHRSRRERMAREGMLLQTDGSRHRWFGPNLPYGTLGGTIDDATSRVTGGTFRVAEDAAGYFTAFAQTAERYGLPGAVYSDRHSDLHRRAQPSPDPHRAAHRAAKPDPGRARPRRCRDRLDRSLQSRGQGSGRAALGHALWIGS